MIPIAISTQRLDDKLSTLKIATEHNCDVPALLKVFGYTPEDLVSKLTLCVSTGSMVTVTVERYATVDQIKALTAEFNKQQEERKTL